MVARVEVGTGSLDVANRSDLISLDLASVDASTSVRRRRTRGADGSTEAAVGRLLGTLLVAWPSLC